MATGVRVGITLACTDCKRRNYQTEKSKRNSPDRVEFKKYCRWCGCHTAASGDALVARQTRSERRARRAAQAESRASVDRAPQQRAAAARARARRRPQARRATAIAPRLGSGKRFVSASPGPS